jgi:ferredoxin-thioredoxin reductase catalytic subunit
MTDDVKKRLEKLKSDAAAGGYTLNPDEEFLEGLAEGLVANKARYGIESCPCRLLKGAPEDNMDIVCPCVYRDDDLAEYGACYCALYVTDKWNPASQVPERRTAKGKSAISSPETKAADASQGRAFSSLPYPVYRCGVCGYLCANNSPPRVCPICKAGAERFERFI